jgi:hypothetical protein
MLRLAWLIVYLVSLAITLMCGIAAITISAAVVTGKLTDADAWETAAFLAVVGYFFWLLCRAAKSLAEPD